MMFAVNLPEVPYSDPWNIPLHQRIKMLARGKRRIAYFYETANNSTFRYRAYNMVQVLNEENNNDVSASYFFLDDLNRIDEIADYADLLVICRTGYSNRINQLITRFRVLRKRVLFDIDDLVFNTSYAHLIMSTLDQNTENAEALDYWFAYLGRMGETLRMCDGALTTNDYLAGRISVFSGLPVNVVPNFINKEQLELSESLFCRKEESGFASDDKICIGYFSGSPSHNLDYAIITSALEEVMENDSRVELMVVGYIDAGPQLSRFGRRIKRQPFHDYVNLQRLVGSVEFNLMPLQSNDFTNCKSELKYFEAAIVGTLSIASPSHTYAAAIQDGKNGYIAQAHQWTSVIQRAIENFDLYPHMAAIAYADARSKYTYLNQRERILQALGLE
jgi:glycosyltransferase involved in cell wall biosynthesis